MKNEIKQGLVKIGDQARKDLEPVITNGVNNILEVTKDLFSSVVKEIFKVKGDKK